MSQRIFLIFYLIIIACSNTHATTVGRVDFEGLAKTNPDYLISLLDTKVNDEYDSAIVAQDVFLLRNLNLFFEVHSEVSLLSDSTMSVVFVIREARYLYPIFSISGFDDQLKINAGFNQINFLGRVQNFGAVYQYYDRHSFSVFHSQKRHSNKLTGHEASLSKYSTVEPLYFKDTVSSFNFDNYAASAGLFFWLNNYLRASIGGQYMYERYEQIDSAILDYIMPFNFNKFQVRTSLDYNKIEYVYELLEGVKYQLFAEYIGTNNFPDARFFKTTAQVSMYKMFGNNGNLALNTKFGISTNNFSPFSPFVLDGFLNVRGVGNRVERGTAEWIINVEYRHTVYRNDYFSIQGVVFTDYGAIRAPGERLSTFFNQPETHLFSGGGIRFRLKKWYNTSLRVDYSVNVTNTKQQGLTFGFGQFF
ncbi:MAG: hypothetical protein COA33_011045 [Fluviicola sp.]|nr:hypothetical protein [Fluviicola sp.]